jgi:glycosyltransferase 2 family protein
MNGASGVTDAALPAPPPAATKRSSVARLARHLFVVAVVVAVVALLWRQRDDVGRALEAISPGRVLLSLVLGLLGAWLPGVVWRDLLVAQGYPTPAMAGQRAFFLAQLGKYLPGGIWSLVAQVSMAREMKIPGRQAATASFLGLALSIIGALLVAGGTLPFAVPALVTHYWWAFLAVPVLVVLLHPRSVEWWSGTAFRILRRPGEPIRLSWAVLVRSIVLLLISWVALGLHFGVLVQGLGATHTSLWLLGIGVFALAWVAGFLIVIAPAGAGVREAALVLGFVGMLPAPQVLTVAVLSRVLLVVVDVLLAGVFTATARFGRHGRAAPAPATGDSGAGGGG